MSSDETSEEEKTSGESPDAEAEGSQESMESLDPAEAVNHDESVNHDEPTEHDEEVEAQASEPEHRREPRESRPRREYSDYRKPRDERPEANTFDVSASVNAPRRVHGTRVAFTFTCAGCEKEATLDYKPKGIPVDELLCEDCMSSQENAGRWRLIRSKKDMEDQKKTHELVCTECGNIEYSRHPPRPGREHLCERCLMEQAQPDKSRLEGAARVEGGVMMRKKKKSPEKPDD